MRFTSNYAYGFKAFGFADTGYCIDMIRVRPTKSQELCMALLFSFYQVVLKLSAFIARGQRMIQIFSFEP